jgi:hypothetical protein
MADSHEEQTLTAFEKARTFKRIDNNIHMYLYYFIIYVLVPLLGVKLNTQVNHATQNPITFLLSISNATMFTFHETAVLMYFARTNGCTMHSSAVKSAACARVRLCLC